MKGRVVKSTGLWYEVYLPSAEAFYAARLRGRFKQENKKTTNPIAVGDWVEVTQEDNYWVIDEIYDRKNYVIRQSTRKRKFTHIIAANIDQALLVATLAEPRTSLGFIDRFLVSTESFGVPTYIVFNKHDLWDEKMNAYYNELKKLYDSLGYFCMSCSATRKNGIKEVFHVLKDKTSLLSGHSGVGKSTIVNELAPQASQKVGDISSFSKKGTHATTFAEMFRLDKTTFLIDTPGIKEFGIIGIEDNELSHFFPEMRSYHKHCKFYNCSHTHEPGCAVKKALEEGKIAESRYKSYLSMLENEDGYR